MLWRLLYALFFLMLIRILFWMVNAEQFDWPGMDNAIRVLFWGSYFDIISLFYFLSPFILLQLFWVHFSKPALISKGLKIYFTFILFLLLTLSCIDAAYYPFAKTRLGAELFRMAGNEEISLWTYIADYWFYIPLILGMTWLVWKFYPEFKEVGRIKGYIQWPLSLVCIVLLVFTIRGGMRLKPLRSMDTALFVEAGYAPLAISTGFNFLESLQVEQITIPSYYSSRQMEEWMKNDYHMISQSKPAERNIVILILESFGREYCFPQTSEAISYTPFLQKLAQKSTFYEKAYANGTRSVDAIPAILEGVPKLTKTDFMYSNYIKNKTPGFTNYLKPKGYGCYFYHGGKNGTMGFESFLKSRGWNYSGKDQYQGKDADFDGQWGIYDGPYLHFVGEQLKRVKSPFIASVFTLSSHHPYQLPNQFKDSFKSTLKPIHKTIQYADQSLQQFFENIQDEAWFKNTVFIVTADHSSENFTKYYKASDAKYLVPLLVYDPQNERGLVDKNVIQHIDIVPLGLTVSGYEGEIFTLGTFFDRPEMKMAFQNEDGRYQVIMEWAKAGFNGKSLLGWSEHKDNTLDKATVEQRIKVKIQDYNYRMVYNKFY